MHGFDQETLAVYVMTVNGWSSKIGYSEDPGARALDLQVGSVDEINVFWACRLVSREARTLEKAVHKELKSLDRHLRGEWFRIAPPVAVSTITKVAKELGFQPVPDLIYGIGR